MEHVYIIATTADTDTPREALYGDDPLAYTTREVADAVATEYNRQAKSENWGWSYAVVKMPANLPGDNPDDVGTSVPKSLREGDAL